MLLDLLCHFANCLVVKGVWHVEDGVADMRGSPSQKELYAVIITHSLHHNSSSVKVQASNR